VVRDKDLRHEARDSESESINERRTANHEPQRLAHCGKISRNIDRVGDHQRSNQEKQYERRKLEPNIPS